MPNPWNNYLAEVRKIESYDLSGSTLNLETDYMQYYLEFDFTIIVCDEARTPSFPVANGLFGV